MGLKGLPMIAEKLIQAGMDKDMPAALIEQGTTVEQKVHASTLSTLPNMIDALPVQPPTLLIIGTVVSLHHSLDWFQRD